MSHIPENKTEPSKEKVTFRASHKIWLVNLYWKIMEHLLMAPRRLDIGQVCDFFGLENEIGILTHRTSGANEEMYCLPGECISYTGISCNVY